MGRIEGSHISISEVSKVPFFALSQDKAGMKYRLRRYRKKGNKMPLDSNVIDTVVGIVEAIAESDQQEVSRLHIYDMSLTGRTLDLSRALERLGANVTPLYLNDEYQRETLLDSRSAVVIIDREKDIRSLPLCTKFVLTLQEPIAMSSENILTARGIYCLHVPELSFLTKLGQGAVKVFVQNLLRQIDVPDSMKMMSELILSPVERCQGKEIMMLVSQCPDAPAEEKNLSIVRVVHRVPSIAMCSLLGPCKTPGGPNFLIKLDGKPLEAVSLPDLRKLITSAWAIFVDGQQATWKTLETLLDCGQWASCPFANTLEMYKVTT